MNKLLKPSRAQIIYRNRKWAEALDENPKKACGVLRKRGGRCCLAVAIDVSKELGLKVENYEDELNEIPSFEVGDFFGWGSQVPDLYFDNGNTDPASAINDGKSIAGKGISHKKIAKMVRNTFVHPKNPKW